MARFKIILLLTIIKFSGFNCVIVKTGVGNIQGYVEDEMEVFWSIPYGELSSDKPFDAATAYPKFESTFNASTAVLCPQINNSVPIGSIHCLTNNVFRPKETTSNDSLPVMVYVQGGAFKHLADPKTYSPKFLVQNGVIVVVVNYRVGPYGFLCWENSTYSNQGIRDVILSLEWIKDNIKRFGGDKKNVLVFGGSSGAVILETLLFFNTDTLFHKIIVESGSAVSPKVLGEYDEGLVDRITTTLGYEGSNDVDDVVDFLSGVEINSLIQITENDTFSPCQDGYLVRSKARINKGREITVMVGTNDKEMISFSDLSDESFFVNYNYTAEIVKGFRKVKDDMVDLVEEFYVSSDPVESVVEFGSDYWFNYPVDRCLKFYAKHNVTVYRYLFAYYGGRNYIKAIGNSVYKGAAHADELRYILDWSDLQDEIAEDDQIVINRMTAMWTNFAKYGNPTPSTSDLLPVEWLPNTLDSKPYMLIDSALEIRNKPFQKRMAYWHLYYDHYNKTLRSIDLKS